MNTTTHLARHILQFQPNKDAARLCLYHYLIHHCSPETPLSPGIFEAFARKALCYKHWQENRVALSQELQYVLQHYNETYMLDWSFKDISFPDSWQVIEIESRIEAVTIFENWVTKTFAKGCRSRIFYTDRKTYVVIVQKLDGEVVVSEMTRQMLIRRGAIEPLNTDHQLIYTPMLELKPNVVQKIMVSENTTGRFLLNEKKILGRIIRGYVFQHQQALENNLNYYPALFYPLKKLEQYFIDRQSDPTYQELVHTLEKAMELIKMGHPEAENFSKAALQRGESALEGLFTNDNIIKILVDDLRKYSRPSTESQYL